MTGSQYGKQERSPEFYEFAARNILSSTIRLKRGATCEWCDRPALFRSTLVNPAVTVYNCRTHFAGAGIAGNPE